MFVKREEADLHPQPACLKSWNALGHGQYRPPVADGYESRGAGFVNVCSILIVDPSATADGTDRVQARPPTLRQSYLCLTIHDGKVYSREALEDSERESKPPTTAASQTTHIVFF